MSEIDLCFICQKTAFKKCTKCGEVSYCESHEKFHTNEELLGCFPFKVDCLEDVGRVIKASRDIAAGEEIFREKEMVVGPSRSIPPACLGCGRRVNGLVRCTGCRWPLCNLSCSELDLHTAEECKIIAPSGENIPNWDVVTENCSFYQVCLKTSCQVFRNI